MFKKAKWFTLGMVFTLILSFSFSPLAASLTTKIDVIQNATKFKVNGQSVLSDSFTYLGKNYVPVRDIAEMCGKGVSWDSKTNTVNIDDKVEVTPSPSPSPTPTPTPDNKSIDIKDVYDNDPYSYINYNTSSYIKIVEMRQDDNSLVISGFNQYDKTVLVGIQNIKEKLNYGDVIYVEGKIINIIINESWFDEKEALILASTYKKLDTVEGECIYNKTIKTLNINSKQKSGNLELNVSKIEFAEKQVRVYFSISHSGKLLSISSYHFSIEQNNKDYFVQDFIYDNKKFISVNVSSDKKDFVATVKNLKIEGSNFITCSLEIIIYIDGNRNSFNVPFQIPN